VGRIRHALASVAVAVAIAACLFVFGGCGGGGDDGSTTSASAPVPQVTTPGALNADTRSTPTTRQAPNTTTTTPAAPGSGPPGAAPVAQTLAPFRDCLSRHGVDPNHFRPGLQRQQGQTPAEVQKGIQAGIDCIPELPPRLRAAAERLKRRYEQRNG
jgi:hypothetical protein